MPTQFIANKALIERDGNVLIIREASTNPDGTNTGRWDVPGGRMEFGELPPDALKREVREEVGLDVEILEPVAVAQWQPVIRGEKVQIVAIYHRCRYASGQVRLSNEHDLAEWIAPADYAKYNLIPNVVPVFKQYLALRRESQ